MAAVPTALAKQWNFDEKQSSIYICNKKKHKQSEIWRHLSTCS